MRRKLPGGPRDPEKALEAAKLILVRGLSHAKAAKEIKVDRTTVERWTKSDWWPSVTAQAVKELKGGMHDKSVAALSALLDERHPQTVHLVAKVVIPEFADTVPRSSVDRLLRTVGAVFQEYVPPDRLPEALRAVEAAVEQLEVADG